MAGRAPCCVYASMVAGARPQAQLLATLRHHMSIVDRLVTADRFHMTNCIMVYGDLHLCGMHAQAFYMYNLSHWTAFWIVTALILPLSQVKGPLDNDW